MTRKPSNRRIRNVIALGALAPLALATLVACGGDDSSSDADKAASDSTSAPAEEPSEDPAEGDTIDPAEFMAALVSAVKDGTTAHIALAVDGAGTNISAEGDLNYETDPPEMKLVMNIPQVGEGIEVLIVDDSMYMQIPGLGDGKFVKMDLDDPTNPLGDQLTGNLDLRSQIKNVEGAVKSVIFVGAEDVDGEELQHYTLVMDGAKLPNQEGVTMPDEINYEIWVDDDNLMRKLSFETAGATISSTVSDWGKKVVIRAPRPGQIMELPKSP